MSVRKWVGGVGGGGWNRNKRVLKPQSNMIGSVGLTTIPIEITRIITSKLIQFLKVDFLLDPGTMRWSHR